ncbi:MAG: dUTP diphosphatase [Patescibacteria group bacterium]
MKIKIKKLDPSAILPAYAHKGDAGMDMFAVRDVLLKKGELVRIPTGIAMEIPKGYVGLVWDRSGLAMNYCLKTLGGVIDSGYRGEIMIGIINLGGADYVVEKGHKVAQMLIQKIESPVLEEVEKLTDSERGAEAFGSTGK